MRKRILSLLLCVCMTVMLPAAVWAVEPSDENTAAIVTIGSDTTGYATFNEAWVAANASNVTSAAITVVKSTHATDLIERFQFGADGQFITLNIQKGVTLTLDMGFDITRPDVTMVINGAPEGSPSAAENGKIVVSDNQFVVETETGEGITLEIRDCTMEATTHCSVYSGAPKADISIINSKATSEGSTSVNVFGSGSHVTIRNSAIIGSTNYNGMVVGENVAADIEENSSFTGFNGIHIQKGTANFKSGTITVPGYGRGVTIEGGTLNFTDGTINAPDGYGVEISSGGPNTTVIAGTINAATGVSVLAGSVAVSGAEINAKNSGVNVTDSRNGSVLRESGSVAVSDGAIRASNGTAFEQHGTGTAELSGGTYTGAVAAFDADVTLDKLLTQGNYGYFRNGSPIANIENMNQLSGSDTITVGTVDPNKKIASLELYCDKKTVAEDGKQVTIDLGIKSANLPADAAVTVTCTSDPAVKVNQIENEQGDVWRAVVPTAAESQTYMFEAVFEQDDYYPASSTCQVTIDAAAAPIVPAVTFTATPAALTGGGMVTLTVSGLPEGVAIDTIECKSDNTVQLVKSSENTWTVTLPDTTKTYTFHAGYAGDAAHAAFDKECTVSVTASGSSSGGGSSSGSSSGGGSASGSTGTTRTPDGSTVVLTTDASGKTRTEVTLSDRAVSNAASGNTPVALPMAEVTAVSGTDSAPVVKVNTGRTEEVKVEIPVSNVTPGTVAVLVKADGTEEIIKRSVTTEKGIAVALSDGAAVKILDNSKFFVDVPVESWEADAVNFICAREIFSGTGNEFSPSVPATRAMLMTGLARLDGENIDGGSVWYEKGRNWAMARGISDGSNPNDWITREQLAVMLWNYAGHPGSNASLDRFADADSASDYAVEALRWAVSNGVISGYKNGQLDPQGLATRAQAAQMIKNFIEM